MPKGPDFYSYYREHQELLGSDGVHPNADGGGQAMHHLWAEALAPLYAAGDTAKPGESTEKLRTGSVSRFALPTISMQNRQIVVQGVPVNAEVSLVSAIGTVVEKIHTTSNTVRFSTGVHAGHYLVVVRNAGHYGVANVVVK
ncbi:hypothetical protein [Fibrobacter sp. UWB13]|uniref:hypothetical protein n=1 Tax=Fibrobacter sp. UWB13 TaxID=1896204 RepID=UPI00111C1DA6|nr:hypothetical protein [Fibrobacter sp. UWB13]